jgi:hypothetical protein
VRRGRERPSVSVRAEGHAQRQDEVRARFQGNGKGPVQQRPGPAPTGSAARGRKTSYPHSHLDELQLLCADLHARRAAGHRRRLAALLATGALHRGGALLLLRLVPRRSGRVAGPRGGRVGALAARQVSALQQLLAVLVWQLLACDLEAGNVARRQGAQCGGF